MSTKRLLGVFAHPDDEGFVGGALLHYHSLGVETGLVYATRGEICCSEQISAIFVSTICDARSAAGKLL